LLPVRILAAGESGDPRGAVSTIGVFDGVHRGHQAVLAKVTEAARQRDAAATVVTFHPHPVRVIDPLRAPPLIESLELRLKRFAAAGIEQVHIVHFDETTKDEEAAAFVARVVVGQLRAHEVIVGDDFRFGRQRGGDVATLAAAGIDVDALGAIGDVRRYSSTVARQAIARGDLVEAVKVLGRSVVVSGEVVHGDGRGGKELGFPTANLATVAEVVTPGEGVYAAMAQLADQRWWPCAVSIGRRPQFLSGADVLIEGHVLGDVGDLYGQWVSFVLLEYLRGEATFATVDDLKAQMHADVVATEVIARGWDRLDWQRAVGDVA